MESTIGTKRSGQKEGMVMSRKPRKERTSAGEHNWIWQAQGLVTMSRITAERGQERSRFETRDLQRQTHGHQDSS